MADDINAENWTGWQVRTDYLTALCKRCGALCANMPLHDGWHDSLTPEESSDD